MSFPYWLSIRGQCRPRCRSLGYWWPRLLGGQCRPPVVPVCGLDVVVSIGRPRLLVLSSKGKSRATKERGRYWLGSRCHSLGYWWPWSFHWRLSVSWPVSASIGLHRLLVLSSKGKSRATKERGRYWLGSRCHSLGNWWPRLLGGQCRPPVVPVCGLDVVASIGRPRLLVLSAKGNEQGNESRAQLVAVVSWCGNWWPRSCVTFGVINELRLHIPRFLRG